MVLEYYPESKSEEKEERICLWMLRSHSDGSRCLVNKGFKITRTRAGTQAESLILQYFFSNRMKLLIVIIMLKKR